MQALRFEPSSVAQDAADLVQYCKDMGQNQCNLMLALDKQWAHLHRMMQGGGAPVEASSSEESEGPVAAKPSLCWASGLCLCDVEGVRIRACRNLVLRAIKDRFG